MPELRRRTLLRAGGLAAAAIAAAIPGRYAEATSDGAPGPRFGAPAYLPTGRPKLTHGVQSGEPTAHSALVWTRADRPGRMVVEVSRRPDFRNARRVRGPLLTPDSDFTGQVALTGLPA